MYRLPSRLETPASEEQDQGEDLVDDFDARLLKVDPVQMLAADEVATENCGGFLAQRHLVLQEAQPASVKMTSAPKQSPRSGGDVWPDLRRSHRPSEESSSNDAAFHILDDFTIVAALNHVGRCVSYVL